MNVSELIKILQKLPQDYNIICGSLDNDNLISIEQNDYNKEILLNEYGKFINPIGRINKVIYRE